MPINRTICRVFAVLLTTSLLVDPGLAPAPRAAPLAPQRFSASSLLLTQTLNARSIPFRTAGLYWYWTGFMAGLAAAGIVPPHQAVLASVPPVLPEKEMNAVTAALQWATTHVIATGTQFIPATLKNKFIPLSWRQSDFQQLCVASRTRPSAYLYDAMVRILKHDPKVRQWALTSDTLTPEDRRLHQQIFEGSERFANLSAQFAELDVIRRLKVGEHYSRRMWFDPRSESWMLETLYTRGGFLPFFSRRVAWTRVRYSRNWSIPKLLNSETEPLHQGRRLYGDTVTVLTRNVARAREIVKEFTTLRDLYDAIPSTLRLSHFPANSRTWIVELTEKGVRGKDIERHLIPEMKHAICVALRKSKTPDWYKPVLRKTTQGKPLYENGLTELELKVDFKTDTIDLYARRENVSRDEQALNSPEVDALILRVAAEEHLSEDIRVGVAAFIARFEDLFGHLPPKTMLREMIQIIHWGALDFRTLDYFLSGLIPDEHGRTPYTRRFHEFVSTYDFIGELQRGTKSADLAQIPELEDMPISSIRQYWATTLVAQDRLSPAEVLGWITESDQMYREFRTRLEPIENAPRKYGKDKKVIQLEVDESLLAHQAYGEALWNAAERFAQNHTASSQERSAMLFRLVGAALMNDQSLLHQILFKTLTHGSATTTAQFTQFIGEAHRRTYRRDRLYRTVPPAALRRASTLSSEELRLLEHLSMVVASHSSSGSTGGDVVLLSDEPPADDIRRYYTDRQAPASDAVRAILSGKVDDWEFTFDDVVESVGRRPLGAVSAIFESILKELSEESRIEDAALPLDRSLGEAFEEMTAAKHKALPHYAEARLYLERVEAARLAAEGAVITGISPYVAEHLRKDIETYTFGIQTLEVLRKPIVLMHKRSDAASYRLSREGDLLHLRPETLTRPIPGKNKVEQVKAQLRARSSRAAAALMALSAFPFLSAFTGDSTSNVGEARSQIPNELIYLAIVFVGIRIVRSGGLLGFLWSLWPRGSDVMFTRNLDGWHLEERVYRGASPWMRADAVTVNAALLPFGISKKTLKNEIEILSYPADARDLNRSIDVFLNSWQRHEMPWKNWGLTLRFYNTWGHVPERKWLKRFAFSGELPMAVRGWMSSHDRQVHLVHYLSAPAGLIRRVRWNLRFLFLLEEGVSHKAHTYKTHVRNLFMGLGFLIENFEFGLTGYDKSNSGKYQHRQQNFDGINQSIDALILHPERFELTPEQVHLAMAAAGPQPSTDWTSEDPRTSASTDPKDEDTLPAGVATAQDAVKKALTAYTAQVYRYTNMQDDPDVRDQLLAAETDLTRAQAVLAEKSARTTLLRGINGGKALLIALSAWLATGAWTQLDVSDNNFDTKTWIAFIFFGSLAVLAVAARRFLPLIATVRQKIHQLFAYNPDVQVARDLLNFLRLMKNAGFLEYITDIDIPWPELMEELGHTMTRDQYHAQLALYLTLMNGIRRDIDTGLLSLSSDVFETRIDEMIFRLEKIESGSSIPRSYLQTLLLVIFVPLATGAWTLVDGTPSIGSRVLYAILTSPIVGSTVGVFALLLTLEMFGRRETNAKSTGTNGPASRQGSRNLQQAA